MYLLVCTSACIVITRSLVYMKRFVYILNIVTCNVFFIANNFSYIRQLYIKTSIPIFTFTYTCHRQYWVCSYITIQLYLCPYRTLKQTRTHKVIILAALWPLKYYSLFYQDARNFYQKKKFSYQRRYNSLLVSTFVWYSLRASEFLGR